MKYSRTLLSIFAVLVTQTLFSVGASATPWAKVPPIDITGRYLPSVVVDGTSVVTSRGWIGSSLGGFGVWNESSGLPDSVQPEAPILLPQGQVVSDGDGGWFVSGMFRDEYAHLFNEQSRAGFFHLTREGRINRGFPITVVGMATDIISQGDTVYVSGSFYHLKYRGAEVCRPGVFAFNRRSHELLPFTIQGKSCSNSGPSYPVANIALSGNDIIAAATITGGSQRLEKISLSTGEIQSWGIGRTIDVINNDALIANASKVVVPGSQGVDVYNASDGSLNSAVTSQIRRHATNYAGYRQALIGDSLYLLGAFLAADGFQPGVIAKFSLLTGEIDRNFTVSSSLTSTIRTGSGFVADVGRNRIVTAVASLDANSGALVSPIRAGINRSESVVRQVAYDGEKIALISDPLTYKGTVDAASDAGLYGIDAATNTPTRIGPANIGRLLYADGEHYYGTALDRIIRCAKADCSNPEIVAQFSDGVVLSITGDSDRIYVGGSFTGIRGEGDSAEYNIGYFAALSKSNWQILPWRVQTNAPVHALAVSGTNLHVGGTFSATNFRSRVGYTVVNTTTGEELETTPAVVGAVYDLKLSGGDLFMAGAFQSIEGESRRCLARLNPTTLQLSPWNAGGCTTGIFVSAAPMSNIVVTVVQSWDRSTSTTWAFDRTTGQKVPWYEVESTWRPGAFNQVQGIAYPDGREYVVLTSSEHSAASAKVSYDGHTERLPSSSGEVIIPVALIGTPTPYATQTPRPTLEPSETPTAVPTETSTVVPSAIPTQAPTAVPSSTSTVAPVMTATPIPSVTVPTPSPIKLIAAPKVVVKQKSIVVSVPRVKNASRYELTATRKGGMESVGAKAVRTSSSSSFTLRKQPGKWTVSIAILDRSGYRIAVSRSRRFSVK